ncbi:MAG: hypothetical protein KGL39_44335 [Patescibacteria group bacterium]|nr:hypothetical protein [Patescibacteria group bacterium]
MNNYLGRKQHWLNWYDLWYSLSVGHWIYNFYLRLPSPDYVTVCDPETLSVLAKDIEAAVRIANNVLAAALAYDHGNRVSPSHSLRLPSLERSASQ